MENTCLLPNNSPNTDFSHGVHLLDAATGTALRQRGLPKGVCMAQWLLEHPQPLLDLQASYAEAGSELIYAPTFQAQPLALAAWGLEERCEEINRRLLALSQQAVPNCCIAGNLTTLRPYLDSGDRGNQPRLVEEYRRQMAALLEGGADILVGETLLCSNEAEAILLAAQAEGAKRVWLSFAAKADGTLRSGEAMAEVFPRLEAMGAAALGVNCIAANEQLPPLLASLRAVVKLPLLCKPNVGRPGEGEAATPESFAAVQARCVEAGASLIGGCCGTDASYLRRLRPLTR